MHPPGEDARHAPPELDLALLLSGQGVDVLVGVVRGQLGLEVGVFVGEALGTEIGLVLGGQGAVRLSRVRVVFCDRKKLIPSIILTRFS